ncbi:DUF4374 domain-containing protein [Sphingobacterium bambusae]|uniref:DUF4374 domain-containing protein n=1 Tax=Sphingobacterium bambusae TaxID=662858 RepID=A0ABW6BLH8_9SPHI|nr:DUF4374 domain-containing protein [Sphingobacterium bambusae]WPL46665.1 DUF4374 domain-containing protein [Sphingobacterium bambusae]
MYSIIKRSLFGSLALAAVTFLSVSCSDSSNEPDTPAQEEPNFIISYSTDNGTFMVPIKDLMNGVITPVGNGTDVTSIFTWGENKIQKGKYFYHLDPTAKKFGKYSIENGLLQTIKVVPFSTLSSLYLGWHTWLDDTHLAFGPRSSNEYTVVDINTLDVTASGTFDTGTAVPKDHQIRLYAMVSQGDKIFLGYSLYNQITKVVYDTTYTAVVDYPNFANFKLTGKDLRSNPIGPVRNGYFHKFKDNGYTYLMTYPMPMLGGGKANMPTGFFRIKDGEQTLDQDYFFNVSAQRNGDNQLGVQYLGNGKALLISAHDAANNVKVKDDWWYAVMWEYLIVDVNTQKVVKKLDFPLVSNSSSALVHNGKAYIAVNDPTADAIYIWEYDPETDKLTRGAKIEGGDNDTPILYNLNK